MGMPGFVSVYNRLPRPVEFQCDSHQYVIKPHTHEVVTIAMAQCAIRHSMYKLDQNLVPLYGITLSEAPDATPLTERDLHSNDPVLGNEIVFDHPEQMHRVPVAPEGVGARRRSIDKTCEILPGATQHG